MTTLTQTSEIFKKYLWVLGLVALILVLTALIIFRFTAKKAPPTKTVIEKPDLGTITIGTSDYKFDNLSLPEDYPKELPVYSKQNTDLLGKAEPLAQKLNFADAPIELDDANFGQGLLYANERGALSVYKGNISYQRYLQEELPSINNLTSLDELKQKAQVLLDEVGLPANLSTEVNSIYYRAIEEFLEKVESPQEADFATLEFNFQIGSTALLTSSKPPFSVTFNRIGDVASFTYNSLAVGPAGQVYPLIAPKEAAEEVLRGTARLVNLTSPNTYNPPPNNFATVDLQKAKLAYFYPLEQELIQPVWIFYGISQGEEGETQLIYAVPAIPQDLFAKP